jgi:RsiW-degrading membrane proteinase PrsW (M82 family)
VALFHLLRFESFSLDDSINSIICLGMWKFLQKTTLTLMLLLHELRKKNVFSLFTILTGIILIVAIGLLGESGFWIYSSPSAWDIIVQYLIGVILLLSAIVYTEHIRDISF